MNFLPTWVDHQSLSLICPFLSYTTAELSRITSPMASPPPFSPGLIEPPAYGSSTNIHKINGQKILPLVSVPELKAHLLLLGAFHRLKTNVEEAEWFIFEKGSALPLMEVKWALFVERAVERFKIWLQRVVQRPERSKRPLAGREIPPLDVLMVLHTYCKHLRLFLQQSS